MSKTKSLFRCQGCGYVSLKWLGRCPECGEWNTLVEEVEVFTERESTSSFPPKSITSIFSAQKDLLSSGIIEFDRVLGGGIVPGSLVLLGGEPGIGKSTLLLQVGHAISQANLVTLIISGEESASQIRMRADRIGALSDNLLLYCETNLEKIIEEVEKTNPSLVVVDSIQTIYHPELSSAPGSVGQVRECAGYLLRLAKSRNIPIFLIGHVTKEGVIAGPRVLEHVVDTVLYFEGDSNHSYRIIRSVKNRYGSTNEIGVFEMRENGLKEATNPSSFFLSLRKKNVSGSTVTPVIEGTRPFLIEVQALVNFSFLPTPRRLALGLDYNRLLLVLAVLERRAGLKLFNQDIYVSVAGGVRVDEPAVDLAVALSVFSAFKDKEIPSDLVAFGEIGLSGEVRPVPLLDFRLKEAEKLGFSRVIMPKYDKIAQKELKIEQVENVKEAFNLLK